jgi:chromosome segregation ATPase
MNHGSSGYADNDNRSFVVCPTCQRKLTVQPGTRADRFQCPKCLTTVSNTPETRPDRAENTDGDIAELKEKLEALSHQQSKMAELTTDMEIMTTENTSLRAVVEGLQAERMDLLGKMDEQAHQLDIVRVSTTPETRTKPDQADGMSSLHDELKHARAALKDVAQIAVKISELEQQVYDLGLQVVKATCRAKELEIELDQYRNGEDYQSTA